MWAYKKASSRIDFSLSPTFLTSGRGWGVGDKKVWRLRLDLIFGWGCTCWEGLALLGKVKGILLSGFLGATCFLFPIIITTTTTTKGYPWKEKLVFRFFISYWATLPHWAGRDALQCLNTCRSKGKLQS